MKRILASVCSLAVVMAAGSASAEEGMWLPNRLPIKLLAERYGFEPTRGFTELLQRASVRLPGCSGSFVSSEGLVMTNHHCAIGCAAENATADDDIVEHGFLARERSDERQCRSMDLDALQAIEDITAQVQAAVTAEMDASQAEQARRAKVNGLEAERSAATGLSCEAVQLYNGAEYHLYCYRTYTDVRLVFVPEVDIARFGGDPDNFEFPRYDLDVAFLRAYVDGVPARPSAFFRWRNGPLQDGEFVIVSGHPGRTERHITADEARFLRDTAFPSILNIIRRFEIALQQFGNEGAEEARIVDDELFGWQNARKAYTGMLARLQDPSFMDAKDRMERDLSPGQYDEFARSFIQVSRALGALVPIYNRLRVLERGNGFSSTYFDYARTIVRLTAERGMPNAERLREYSDASLPALEQQLFAETPVYDDLETAKLAESLTLLTETLGAYDSLVEHVLAGKSPRDRAYELVSGTRLKHVAFRRQLVQGGTEAVLGSDDPMIRLALLVDAESRRVRRASDEAAELKRQAYAKLAGLRLQTVGTGGYPDATFTLRFSFGLIKGYEENGRVVPAATTFEGLYRRSAEHGNLRPWRLPARWLGHGTSPAPSGRSPGPLDLDTPFNFVSTNDITGGNSGSPVLDRQGRVVGIIFDGNIQSLGNEFAYSEEQARAVSVSAAGIVEALTRVYDAVALVNELGR